MWQDGGIEKMEGDVGYELYENLHVSTKPGKYYGGHNPCEIANNYPLCGDWEGITIY